MSVTNPQRLAVFTVHRGRCWLCNTPVAFNEMEVEHIIPESLIGNAKLADVLKLYGRSEDFDLNSYENWMPAHRRCNGFKGDLVLEAAPIVLIWLQKAAAAAAEARRIEKAAISERELDRSIARVLVAIERGQITDAQREAIGAIASFVEAVRPSEDKEEPLTIVAGLRVVANKGHYLVLQAPGGAMGHRPAGDNVHHSYDCPYCGPTAWDGSRCIKCGRMIELD